MTAPATTAPIPDLSEAEKRISAARSDLSAGVKSVKAHALKSLKSPWVIGAATAAVAAVAAAVVLRQPKARPKVMRLPGKDNFTRVLGWVQRLLPLIGGFGAAKMTEPDPRSFPVVIPTKKDTSKAVAAAPAHQGFIAKQWGLTKAAFTAWSDDYAPSMGAALSYYTLFSLAPLLIIVIGVAGMVFGQDAAQGAIVGQLQGILGKEGATAVEGMLKSVRGEGKDIVATIVGFVLLILGATAVFGELQSALDRIWRAPAPEKESGIWHLLRTRLLSFGLLIGLGFLLIVSLVVSAVIAALGKWWSGWFQGWDVLLEVINFFVSFGIFTVLFAMIYKIMPRPRISWHDVWTGAGVTALLFTVGKVLIGLYLGKSSIASGFGAAGSIVLLLAWVYYSAQIFLLGAEYTWVYAKQHGSHAGRPAPEPAPAVPARDAE